MKRFVLSLAFGVLAGLLLLPIGERGGCPSGGGCYSTPFSLVGLPTHWLAAVVVVPLAALLTWWLYPRWQDRHMGP